MPSIADIVSSVGIPSKLQGLLSGSHLEARNTVTTTVKGFAELEAALNKLPDEIAKKVLVAAVTEGTETFRQRAMELAPYDTEKKEGMHLIDGIRKEIRTGSHGVKGGWVHGKVGLHPDVFYGRFIEFGWDTPAGTKVQAQPFMRPAFDGQRDRVVVVISQRLEAGIAAACRELYGK